MIRTAMEFIKKELEAYMVDREQDATYSPGNVVDLKALVSPEGVYQADDNTHITIMVLNVQENSREGKRPYYIPANDKEFYRLNPPIELELSVLFAAHNKDYPTALRDVSDVVGFFQSSPVFDSAKYPSLNASVVQPDNKPWQLIERITFSLYNLSFDQQNNIWSMLGAKFMPCVMYKMNMLTVFDTKGRDKAAAINELNLNEN